MIRKLLLLTLLVPAIAVGDPTAYRTKNTATRVCGTIMNATTAKRIGAAVTGIDCEYAQVLDGTSESAFADLSTAEAVVGTVGQFCALVTAGEINIDGDLRIHCSASNTNAADWLTTLTTRGGKVEASGIAKTSFADDGQLTSESGTTLGLASGGITADNQNVNRAIVVYSNANRAIELARSCITASANTGDTVTTKTDISGSITGAGGSADYYAIIDDAACSVLGASASTFNTSGTIGEKINTGGTGSGGGDIIQE